MRSIDVALAFPSVLIALLVTAAFSPGWATVVIAVGLINVPLFCRPVRATVISIVTWTMSGRERSANCTG